MRNSQQNRYVDRVPLKPNQVSYEISQRESSKELPAAGIISLKLTAPTSSSEVSRSVINGYPKTINLV